MPCLAFPYLALPCPGLSLPSYLPGTREAIDLMLGTDPEQPIPSAAELLQHPWFPSDDRDTEAPLPLAPGQKVAVGPPAKPEAVPTGLPPQVPKLGGTGTSNGLASARNSTAAAAAGGEGEGSPFIELADGSKALSAWLLKRTSTRNALGIKSNWWVGL